MVRREGRNGTSESKKSDRRERGEKMVRKNIMSKRNCEALFLGSPEGMYEFWKREAYCDFKKAKPLLMK